MVHPLTGPLAAAMLAAGCIMAAASSPHAQTPAPPAAADSTKATFEGLCSSCHALATVTTERHSRAEWDEVVHRMAERGMVATETQMTAAVDYLTKSLPPAP
jgi:cytochrome c5